MSALPPIRRKHRICVICEGYEDYHYFNRLIALNLWDASYSFTTINVKSASNIPARFQNEYRKALMADLREVQQAFSGSEELESRLRELDERLNAEADEVQEMIATNARSLRTRMNTAPHMMRRLAGTNPPRRSGTVLPRRSGRRAFAAGNSNVSSRNWKSCPTR